MKVAILGGGGCFSLNFARHLHSIGVDCFGIGRSGPKPAAFWLAPDRYRFHALHLASEVELTLALALLDEEKPDIIVNFAAQGEGAASFGDYAPDFFSTNCTALVRLVCELRKRDYFQRFIQISTSELYGSTEKPANESAPLNPTSPYAISKAGFDQYLQAMHRINGFPMNILRPSNCYTPGQQLHRIIPKAIICALAGRKLPLEGGGMARKSYLHADDLSRAIVAVVNKAEAGKVYNVGPIGVVAKNGVDFPALRQPFKIWELVNIVALQRGMSLAELTETVSDRVGQDSCYWIDSSALFQDTGWRQEVGIEEGVAGMIAWVKAHPELLAMNTGYEHRS